MEFRKRLLPAISGVGALLASLILAGQAPAVASAAHTRPHHAICQGSSKHPGVVAGTYYGSLKIEGLCYVNKGSATIKANLVVSPHSALVAIWGNGSSITVEHDLIVERGGALVLGCERKMISTFGHEGAVFPCINDPDQKHPTYSSHDTVNGYLIANHPLGVVVHYTSVGRNIDEVGGGGGLNCKPSGPFAAFNSPVYSDFEDNQIGGSLRIIGVHSCWTGAIRNTIGVDLTVHQNVMKDRDSMEVDTNWVGKDLSCLSNSPKVQFGDGDGLPNVTAGRALGECGSHVVLADPAKEAHLHVHVTRKHLSIHI